MRRRIYLNILLLTSLAVLLASALLSAVFYRQFSAQIRRDLREQAEFFLNDTTGSALEEIGGVAPTGMRITLIRADGSVLFDNASAAQSLENHLEREEVQEAISTGYGESSRRSSTLGLRTYYYAVRLTDRGVVRFAKTAKSVWGLFAGALPTVSGIIAVVMVACYVAAGGLTRRIIAPINEVDFSGALTAPYDELAPFVRTIARQQQKIAEDVAALQKSADTMQAITEQLNEGVVMVDAQGTILSVNRSAAQIFDAGGPLEGRSIRELSRDLALMEGVQRALAGSAQNMTYAKGEQLYSVLLSPVPQTGAILFLLDITEKALADQRRREFSANVSHELKTPLTSIYGNAEMLCSGVVQEGDRPRFYQKIMDEAARLMTLIEDILKISELDEGPLLQAAEAVDLAQLAQACAEALAQKAAAGSVHLQVQGAGRLYGRASMLYEMLYNLMDNAITYNRPGGSVRVEIAEAGAQTTVRVADTGIGIPAGEQERVFERFYRVDRSRSKKTGGTGLGLAIVKHVAMAHGGVVRIVDTNAGGTTIEVAFARRSADGAPPE
ncbi:MAG: PAS domain-containing protein [Clostridiales bacterium]|nr:PAS domain-containing protein [Clostridiales bacterium]